jgi:hypothetical protein
MRSRVHCQKGERAGNFLCESRSGIVGMFMTKLTVYNSDSMFAFFARRRDSPVTVGFVCRFFCLLFLAGLVAGVAAGTADQSVPVGPGLPFAVADFDGDLRPDLAGVQVGQSDLSNTDYWIQLQLSAAGRQTILIVAPAGGLQVTARDVNGDHTLDLVLTAAWLREPIAIFLNDGHGSFSRVDPTTFPEAFRQSETSWSSSDHQAPDTFGIPPQSRVGICSATARRPHLGSLVSVIPRSHCGYLRSPFLDSQASRAPPFEVSQPQNL